MVVGDSLKNDIQPAQQLGCQTVWLNVNTDENFNHADRNKSNASTSVKTITDLSQLLGVLTNCC
jgi:FMN phosphatase YigB (HAD superfamily)